MDFIFFVLTIPSMFIALIYLEDMASFLIKKARTRINYPQYVQRFNKYPEKQFAKVALFAIPSVVVFAARSFCLFIPNGDYKIFVTANILDDLSLYAEADISIVEAGEEAYREVCVNSVSFTSGNTYYCGQYVDLDGGTVEVYGDDNIETEIVVPKITQAVLGITPQYIATNNKATLFGYAFLIVSNLLYILNYIDVQKELHENKNTPEP